VRIGIAFLLGAWMLGTVLLGGVASENFFMIDRLLDSSSVSSPRAHPTFQKDAAQLPPGEARVMLRYVSSELNRFYFNVWGWFELGLASLAVLLAVRGSLPRRITIGFGVMLALVAVMTIYITPRITEVGRALDFVPRNPAPPSLATFGMLHAAYSFMDMAKLGIGIWLAVALMRSEKRSSASVDAFGDAS
jgi:hypothetical protein